MRSGTRDVWITAIVPSNSVETSRMARPKNRKIGIVSSWIRPNRRVAHAYKSHKRSVMAAASVSTNSVRPERVLYLLQLRRNDSQRLLVVRKRQEVVQVFAGVR